mmetsp:Transcript_7650/g.12888  ORF Transcript_7650/g.12888 Transcript_7650/m.12888 type:complete len:114 (-) Transcript_7650:110-451(-)
MGRILTMTLIIDLWSHFGWSIRFSYSCDKSIIFAQLTPVCGHEYYTNRLAKVKAQHPAIELYVMQEEYREGKGWWLKDLYTESSFPLLIGLYQLGGINMAQYTCRYQRNPRRF